MEKLEKLLEITNYRYLPNELYSLVKLVNSKTYMFLQQLSVESSEEWMGMYCNDRAPNETRVDEWTKNNLIDLIIGKKVDEILKLIFIEVGLRGLDKEKIQNPYMQTFIEDVSFTVNDTADTVTEILLKLNHINSFFDPDFE